MIEPVVSTIASLAFTELIKAGAGETGRKAASDTMELVTGLADKIRQRFQGNSQAMSAIAELEQTGSEEALQKVTRNLDLQMNADPNFATEMGL